MFFPRKIINLFRHKNALGKSAKNSQKCRKFRLEKGNQASLETKSSAMSSYAMGIFHQLMDKYAPSIQFRFTHGWFFLWKQHMSPLFSETYQNRPNGNGYRLRLGPISYGMAILWTHPRWVEIGPLRPCDFFLSFFYTLLLPSITW